MSGASLAKGINDEKAVATCNPVFVRTPSPPEEGGQQWTYYVDKIWGNKTKDVGESLLSSEGRHDPPGGL